MRAAAEPMPMPAGTAPQSDWRTLARLAPYLWRYRWRVGAALLMVTGAKLSNVGVPILLKDLVDRMNIKAGDPLALVVVPVGLLLAYGLLRLMTTVFTELRELVFSKATQGATRQVALQTFEHLHSLSLRFHLERQTGGMTRDIERGVRAIEALITYSLYSIIPTLVEVALVLAILGTRFDAGFVWITLAALGAYVVFTVWVTEWRTRFRVEANSADSAAHNHAIDSLLNYETVKYFGNEGFESRRYDESLRRYQRSRLKSQSSLSLLNTGQQLIIGIGLVAMLWRATAGVADGHLSIGDLVMINAFMIQLYIPLNFLGVIYRELKQNLTDLHRMFALMDRPREVADAPGAPELHTNGPVDVSFEHVGFAYESERPILHDVTFSIPAGKTVAVVGPSGSGKSTLARLLYRFYDPCLVPPRSAASHAALPPEGAAADLGRPGAGGGRILIAGQDIRTVTQASVRRAIGIVPQDTVLFNDTIAYNIRYGRPGASDEEVQAVARAARIHDFIVSTPKGYDTMVGERGLKLSGGEKQRVAIARTLLKDPPVLIFDEATSALDSANERAIQAELASAAQGKTTLVIAHRLSTIVDAHQILVMSQGRIVERGTHLELLAAHGAYAQMWAIQRSHQQNPDGDQGAVH
ncbi:ABCB family ABC transporter ATP-binding protein/permease [Ottowia pentelensis]|uniref:ABCB family ABC transporter ATP-binding protein/permease n=1 Tax=Ottowia pentelensis TaxID=511108 RepID=A0ABV6PQZ6_9BURK